MKITVGGRVNPDLNGSGSRKENFQKKYKEIGNHCNLIKILKECLHKLLSNLLFFIQLKKTLHKIVFLHIFKAGSGSA